MISWEEKMEIFEKHCFKCNARCDDSCRFHELEFDTLIGEMIKAILFLVKELIL